MVRFLRYWVWLCQRSQEESRYQCIIWGNTLRRVL